MKVAVAGAGAVGRSGTRELLENGHDVTLIERNPDHVDVDAIPAAHWRLGDACELSLLQSVHLEDFDVVVAATGDDKVNVVLSLLAKTEFAVPRVVARVNDPRNEWLFTDAWGVDTAVSTPRFLASLIEEAVAVAEVDLHEDWVGHRATDLEQATGARVAFVIRFGTGVLPEPKTVIQAGDQVYIAAISGRAAEAVAIAALPPNEDLETGPRK